jgi:uncharacterized membrane protein
MTCMSSDNSPGGAYGEPRNNSAVIMTLTAATTALVLVVTFFLSVPLPATQGQVFDAGDIVIFVTAMTFGPIVGGFAGGVGSAVSDSLMPGGSVFAPFTLVIKGSEGLVAGYLATKVMGGRELWLSWLAGGIVMVAGYFAAESYFIGLVFGASNLPGITAALLELPFNVIQVFVGGLVGIPVSKRLKGTLPSVFFPPKTGNPNPG